MPLPPFHLTHLPALFFSLAHSIGGTMPLWNPPGAIRAFGLNETFASSHHAQTIFLLSGARTSMLGLAQLIFYAQGNLGAVDVIMSLLGYVGVVDAWVCWREGEKGVAVKRLLAAGFVGGWGVLGLTGSEVY
ncbi:hypothetical protein MMC25_005234 [Agyrium rufum]|nr:hypothetical protein [Agyrium rufum]